MLLPAPTQAPLQRVLPFLSVTSAKRSDFLLLLHVVIHLSGIAQQELKVLVSFQSSLCFLRPGSRMLCFTASEPLHKDFFYCHLNDLPLKRFGHSILFLDKFPHPLHG